MGSFVPLELNARDGLEMVSSFNDGVRLLDIDEERAVACFERSARLGCSEACHNLAVIKQNKNDLGTAEFWYREAVALKRSNHKARRSLARLLKKKDTPDASREADRIRLELAEEGDVDSLFDVYRLHLFGDIPDKARARAYCVEAADAGHIEAQHDLGVFCIEEGKPEEAQLWFEKSAEGGFMAAQYNVGTRAYTLRDFTKARKFLTLAAEQGMEDALHNLGTMLLCEKIDIAEGALHLGRAAKMGKAVSLLTLHNCSFDKVVVGTCCIACGETEHKQLRRCKGCKIAFFCNTQCATDVWPLHKTKCKMWKRESVQSVV